MVNVPKQLIRKYSDKILSRLVEAQQNMEGKLDLIYATQLAVNHNQLLVSDNTNRQLKNSGTITISSDEMLTKLFSGLKMYLDPKDLTVAPHIAMDSVWEHEITTAWLKVVGTNDTILDIGANFGYFGALAGQKTGVDSRIIFFEINPKLLPYIRKTIAANWLAGKSKVENLAVADKPGKLTFNVSPYYLGSASLSHTLDESEYEDFKIETEKLDSVTVNAVTIDSYCKKNHIHNVDLIKMDIEGFEDKAYKGMRTIVKSSPLATMFIEFTRLSYEDPKAFYDQMLKDFGNVYVINGDGAIIKPKSTAYDKVIDLDREWSMPIFSKRKDLAKL